jgi:hypothetical protein
VGFGAVGGLVILADHGAPEPVTMHGWTKRGIRPDRVIVESFGRNFRLGPSKLKICAEKTYVRKREGSQDERDQMYASNCEHLCREIYSQQSLKNNTDAGLKYGGYPREEETIKGGIKE